MAIGTLGHALLGLLATRECTGYELTRTFDESLANVWPARHSQIYPELAKLQAAGLIRLSDSGARGSKTYALTEAGKVELRRWLTETVPAETGRSERMLRVFFLWLMPPAEAAAYLKDQVARHRERLNRYAAFAKAIDGAPPSDALKMNRIALEAGIRFEAAMAEWAEWAIKELPNPQSPEPSPSS